MAFVGRQEKTHRTNAGVTVPPQMPPLIPASSARRGSFLSTLCAHPPPPSLPTPADATTATLKADWSQPAAGVSITGTPTFRVQYTPENGQPVVYTEDQFAAHGIQIIKDPNFTSGTHKAIQIVGSPTDAYAPIVG